MKRTGEKGLIIVGYQGIGKSSVASARDRIIDLESSSFKIHGDRVSDWYVVYCRIAVSLARKGFAVLVSSHQEVVKELNIYNPEGDYSVVIITPNYILKDLWIDKLHRRFLNNSSEKNLIAWKDAESHYDTEIAWLAAYPNFSHIFIDSMDYSLSGIISGLRMINRSRANPLLTDRITEGC